MKISRKVALAISTLTLLIAEDERLSDTYSSLYHKGYHKGRADGMKEAIKKLKGEAR